MRRCRQTVARHADDSSRYRRFDFLIFCSTANAPYVGRSKQPEIVEDPAGKDTQKPQTPATVSLRIVGAASA